MATHYLLHTTVFISTCLLISGLTVCIIDLDEYSWGLYMVLVAIVGLLLCIAFCILGPENTAEPTIAKQLWNRATIKLSSHRPSVNVKRHPGRGVDGGVDLAGGIENDEVFENRRLKQLQSEPICDTSGIDSVDTPV